MISFHLYLFQGLFDMLLISMWLLSWWINPEATNGLLYKIRVFPALYTRLTGVHHSQSYFFDACSE